MPLFKECKECLLKMTERIAKAAGAQDITLFVEHTAELFDNADSGTPSPLITWKMNEFIKNKLGVKDPFLTNKQKLWKNRSVIDDIIDKHDDNTLEKAIFLGAVGNIIDLAVFSDTPDIDKFVNEKFKEGFFINDVNQFTDRMKKANKIVILADNFGEHLFDIPLLKFLKSKKKFEIVYITRGAPILNDVTYQDAITAGLSKWAIIIGSGQAIPGTVLNLMSSEAAQIIENADLIISKGQGNFETLMDESRVLDRIFFIFTAKCDPVASLINAQTGQLIMMEGRRLISPKFR